MEMDIDHEDGAADGSSDEGCVVVDVSQRFIVADPPPSAKENIVESDSHKLCQRQKQIDYGKNTLGYERYLELVPRKQRKKSVHPQTPDIKQVCSKRSWDGQVKKWRRRLHEFDPPVSENEEAPQLFLTDDGSAAHNQEDKDATTSSGSEANPKEEVGVSAIYDDWDVDDDAMEP
jgi:histone RNA hairpin-binding protein